jgi:hypothetical protein
MKRRESKKPKKKKILFVAQDPGGFNSLVNVIQKIKNGRFEIKVFLANESRQIAKKHKIKFTDCTNKNKKELEKAIDKFSPDLALVATSMGMSIEKKVLGWAKKNNIKVISIVDFWSNYKMRFSTPGTVDLKYLPNAICIIDEYMKEQMIAEGFNETQLYITGNPSFDTFKKAEKKIGKYILFASQPFSEVFSEIDKKNVDSPIFNEIQIFSDIISVLEKIKIGLPVVVAFHPRSKKRDKYNQIISKSNIKVTKAEGDTLDLIEEAKVVIGINTAVLFRAAMMGKKVISYQPGISSKQDPLISSHLGLSQAAYDYSELERLLKKSFLQPFLSKDFDKIRNKYINNNSTQKVIEIINNFLNK